MSGVLGTLGDIATAVAQFLGATAVTGADGMAAALVIGSPLGEAAGEPPLLRPARETDRGGDLSAAPAALKFPYRWPVRDAPATSSA